jgi:hypothetical protein
VASYLDKLGTPPVKEAVMPFGMGEQVTNRWHTLKCIQNILPPRSKGEGGQGERSNISEIVEILKV